MGHDIPFVAQAHFLRNIATLGGGAFPHQSTQSLPDTVVVYGFYEQSHYEHSFANVLVVGYFGSMSKSGIGGS